MKDFLLRIYLAGGAKGGDYYLPALSESERISAYKMLGRREVACFYTNEALLFQANSDSTEQVLSYSYLVLPLLATHYQAS